MGFGRGIWVPEWAFLLAVCCIYQIGARTEIQQEPGSKYTEVVQQKQNVSSKVNIIQPMLINPVITPSNPAHNGHVCSTWGNFHFKTFDGDIFSFPGLCNYVFASHCNAPYEDFNIQIRRTVVENAPTINHITMKLEGVAAELTKDAVMINSNRVQLPYSQSGIMIEKSSIYVKVASKMGIVLMWNEDDSILLELNEKYANQTCGLCGDFNGFPIYNEFYSNNIKMTPLQFGNMQKMDGPTEHCEDSTSTLPDNCTDNSDDICQKTLTSSAFAECNDLVDVKEYIMACQDDLCHSEESKNASCICDTFTEYSRQCAHAGGHPLNWRTSKLCPKKCPSNMQYQECSSPCADTCTNPERSQFCEEHCMDGCFCPPGTVFDDINNSGCIPPQQCSCVYNGKTYATGTSFSEQCHSCTCNGGQWSCQDMSCPGTCSLEGGSHISTYDKKHYSHHGDCTYVLSKHCKDETFTILVELRKCGLTDTETCLRTVTLNMNKGQTLIEVKPDGGVFMNSIYTQLPISAANATVFRPSSFFIIMQTNFGIHLEIQIIPIMQVFVRLDPIFKDQTCGLCGNFNNIQTDDFRVMSGIIEGTATAFANTWKTQASCPNIQHSFENPCALSIDNEKYAQHWCGLLTDSKGPFADCHYAVNPSVYHTNCMFDTCNCENSEDCLCAALSSYVRACAAKGLQLRGWRTDVCSKYSTSCPKSLNYSYTIASCQPTCRSLSEPDVTCNIKFVPVDGCTCVDGTYMDENGKCVPANECPCYYRRSPIPLGEVVHENGLVCTCIQGRLNCLGAPNPTPVCESPMVYFDCRNVTAGATGAECQKSCQTLDMQCYSTQCVSGCMCPAGLVLDGNGGCIPEEECPCIHNEAMYQPEEKINVDCNTCVCKNRKWECTKDQCLGTCVVYGDGHYNTFDDKRFSFNGNCEYTLVQDHCGKSGTANGTFRVITENIPCGNTGTTCSKSIKVFLESYELILGEEHVSVVKRGQNDEVPYTVRYMGMYLVIETTSGLILMWDKKTSIFIKLSPDFKGQICGLCGNYDGNGINDFTTRSQSVVENVLEFGNSWKVSSTCPDAYSIKDPCSTNLYRKSWSEKQCSIINSNIFAACHSQVEPAKYYQACVTDACACDTGGDCDCFCTAVAAYAQACSEVGVCIAWRTPSICPLFCDYYNQQGECEWHYKPCGASCMKTCRNPSGKCIHNLPGLEGCYPNCPPDKPYFHEDQMKCVSLCDCYDNEDGKIYRRDECHVCECTSESLQCKFDDKACHCIYEGNSYKYGELIYTTTDGTGWCFSATCDVNGTINRNIFKCGISTTTPFTFSTSQPTTTASEMTTATPVTTVCVKNVCAWSEWYDSTEPEGKEDSGDDETFENLRAKGYTVCENPNAVQCRAKNHPHTEIYNLNQTVQCNQSRGLICNNKDQQNKHCYNYEIRVSCCSYKPCSQIHTTTRTTEEFTTNAVKSTPLTINTKIKETQTRRTEAQKTKVPKTSPEHRESTTHLTENSITENTSAVSATGYQTTPTPSEITTLGTQKPASPTTTTSLSQPARTTTTATTVVPSNTAPTTQGMTVITTTRRASTTNTSPTLAESTTTIITPTPTAPTSASSTTSTSRTTTPTTTTSKATSLPVETSTGSTHAPTSPTTTTSLSQPARTTTTATTVVPSNTAPTTQGTTVITTTRRASTTNTSPTLAESTTTIITPTPTAPTSASSTTSTSRTTTPTTTTSKATSLPVETSTGSTHAPTSPTTTTSISQPARTTTTATTVVSSNTAPTAQGTTVITTTRRASTTKTSPTLAESTTTIITPTPTAPTSASSTTSTSRTTTPTTTTSKATSLPVETSTGSTHAPTSPTTATSLSQPARTTTTATMVVPSNTAPTTQGTTVITTTRRASTTKTSPTLAESTTTIITPTPTAPTSASSTTSTSRTTTPTTTTSKATSLPVETSTGSTHAPTSPTTATSLSQPARTTTTATTVVPSNTAPTTQGTTVITTTRRASTTKTSPTLAESTTTIITPTPTAPTSASSTTSTSRTTTPTTTTSKATSLPVETSTGSTHAPTSPTTATSLSQPARTTTTATTVVSSNTAPTAQGTTIITTTRRASTTKTSPTLAESTTTIITPTPTAPTSASSTTSTSRTTTPTTTTSKATSLPVETSTGSTHAPTSPTTTTSLSQPARTTTTATTVVPSNTAPTTQGTTVITTTRRASTTKTSPTLAESNTTIITPTPTAPTSASSTTSTSRTTTSTTTTSKATSLPVETSTGSTHAPASPTTATSLSQPARTTTTATMVVPSNTAPTAQGTTVITTTRRASTTKTSPTLAESTTTIITPTPTAPTSASSTTSTSRTTTPTTTTSKATSLPVETSTGSTHAPTSPTTATSLSQPARTTTTATTVVSSNTAPTAQGTTVITTTRRASTTKTSPTLAESTTTIITPTPTAPTSASSTTSTSRTTTPTTTTSKATSLPVETSTGSTHAPTSPTTATSLSQPARTTTTATTVVPSNTAPTTQGTTVITTTRRASTTKTSPTLAESTTTIITPTPTAPTSASSTTSTSRTTTPTTTTSKATSLPVETSTGSTHAPTSPTTATSLSQPARTTTTATTVVPSNTAPTAQGTTVITTTRRASTTKTSPTLAESTTTIITPTPTVPTSASSTTSTSRTTTPTTTTSKATSLPVETSTGSTHAPTSPTTATSLSQPARKTTTATTVVPSNTAPTTQGTTVISTTRRASTTKSSPSLTGGTTTIITPTPTASTSPTNFTASTPNTTNSCLQHCAWTQWFDLDSPSPGSENGDIEMPAKIRAAGYALCDEPQDIMCRAKDYPSRSLDKLGQKIECSLDTGLVCRNKDQIKKYPMCFDYEIKVLCCERNHCETTSDTTGTTAGVSTTYAPVKTSTTTTQTPAPPTTASTLPWTARKTATATTVVSSNTAPTTQGTTVITTTRRASTTKTSPTLAESTTTIITPTPTAPTSASSTTSTSRTTTPTTTTSKATSLPAKTSTVSTHAPTSPTTASTPAQLGNKSTIGSTGILLTSVSLSGQSTATVVFPTSLTTTSSPVATTGTPQSSHVTASTSAAFSSSPSTPVITEASTYVTSSRTTPCFCHVFGNLFSPGEVVYNRTDKAGCSFYALCSKECEIHPFQGPCYSTTPFTSGTSETTTQATLSTEHVFSSVSPTTATSLTTSVERNCTGVNPPRKPGENWISECHKCVCDPLNATVQCQPLPCQTAQTPICGPGFAAVTALPLKDTCCPKYECRPRPDYCVINGTMYKVGASTVTNSCMNCTCTSEIDEASWQNIWHCERVQCETSCPLGHQYMTEDGKCCGNCTKVSCIIRLSNNTVHKLRVGDILPLDHCSHYKCEKIEDQLVAVQTKKVCPEYKPGECDPDEADTTPDGCCKICRRKNCKPYSKTTVIRHGNCESAEPVELAYCEGTCPGSSVYSLETNQMQHECSCCQESSSQTREVTLTCKNGTSINYYYVYVEECQCMNACTLETSAAYGSKLKKSAAYGSQRKSSRRKR